MSQFATLLTTIGLAKLTNALALGQTIALTHMAFGDGGGNTPAPQENATQLANEVHRVQISASQVIDATTTEVEGVIPTNVGGWMIREVGVFDADGDMIVIASLPDTYKTTTAEGAGTEQVIRLQLRTTNSQQTTLKIDPAIVIATRSFVENTITSAFADHNTDAHKDASTTVRGMVELATPTETKAGTSATLAITPAGLKAAIDAVPPVDTSGMLIAANNLSDLANKATARENLGILPGVPVGMIAAYAKSTAPDGWLGCNGAAISRTKYKNLYAVIGTTYGEGDGSATFNLPNGGRLSRDIVSAEYPVAANSLVTIPHGFDCVPDRLRVVMVCKIAERGYAVGDEVDVEGTFNTWGNGVIAVVDAANVLLPTSHSTPVIISLDNLSYMAPVTAAHWRYKVYASAKHPSLPCIKY